MMPALSPLRSYAPTETVAVSETGRALVVRLPTRHLAYYQRREDDCLAACVASLLQVPIETVPDPRIDERLAAGDDPDVINHEAGVELEAWLADRGLRLVKHSRPPVHCGGWIGVSPSTGRFADHTVLMCLDRLVFDPASNFEAPFGFKVENSHTITHGMTIEAL